MADVTDRLITRVELHGEQGVVRGLSQVGSAMSSLGALAVAGGVAGFFRSSVESFMEAEDVAARFAATMKAVGTNYPVAEAQAYATALEAITTHSDEEILSNMQLLGTFHLNRRQIEALTPLLLDAADGLQAVGRSSEGLAVAMGKALSTGNVGLLQRYGLVVDKTVFKQDRLRAVTEALRRAFGGVSEEMAKTTRGGLTQLANSWDDLKEAIGGALAPMIRQVVPTLKVITQGLQDVDKYTKGWSSRLLVLGGVLGGVVLVLRSLYTVLKGIAVVEALLTVLKGPAGILAFIGALGAAASLLTLFLVLDKRMKAGMAGAGKDRKDPLGDPGDPGAIGGGTGMAAATRAFLGGGDIGRIGINASEIPDIRLRSHNAPVVVRIEPEDTMQQIVNKTIAKLTRHGVIKPAAG